MMDVIGEGSHNSSSSEMGKLKGKIIGWTFFYLFGIIWWMGHMCFFSFVISCFMLHIQYVMFTFPLPLFVSFPAPFVGTPVYSSLCCSLTLSWFISVVILYHQHLFPALFVPCLPLCVSPRRLSCVCFSLVYQAFLSFVVWSLDFGIQFYFNEAHFFLICLSAPASAFRSSPFW